MTSTNLAPFKLWYRVNHPEFDPAKGYLALAHIDYGESAWAQMLFITHTGMTYSVKVHRCLCLNPFLGCFNSEIRGTPGMIFDLPENLEVSALPWPRPKCKNPDLDDD
jgi:hypothetical protein